MCIGVWALDHPDYALILCTNRDEYLDRPTKDAHFHSFQGDHSYQKESSVSGNILSGRDDKAGGSWLGVNRAGRVAFLTNIVEAPTSYQSSRGHLVSSFLLSDSSHPLEDEVGTIVPQNSQFAGFNLLLLSPAPLAITPKETEGEAQELDRKEDPMNTRSQKLTYDALFVTNHGGGGLLEARRLSPRERASGCMSNGVDGKGANEWPKVKKARRDFTDVLQTLPTNKSPEESESELIEKLFHILTWVSPKPITQRVQLRNTVQVTPIPIILTSSDATVPNPIPNTSTSQNVTFAPPLASIPEPGISESKNRPETKTGAAPGYEYYYGTRISTVLLIRRDGSIIFIERDIWRLGRDGKPERLDHLESQGEGETKERVFRFNIEQ